MSFMSTKMLEICVRGSLGFTCLNFFVHGSRDI